MLLPDKCSLKLIDARGLACPMPLLKAKQALGQVAVGEQIRLLATDPGSVRDIQAFVKLTAHSMIEFEQMTDHYSYVLQKGALQQDD